LRFSILSEARTFRRTAHACFRRSALQSFSSVCYLTYHYFHGVTRFPGHGFVRTFYLTLLGSHTILAVVIVPLVLTTLYRAWRQRFDRHRRIAVWTLPLWIYVSVTGRGGFTGCSIT